MTLSYNVTARSYLARARERLNQGTREALFYAAFELRCGIEARLQEYLEAQRDISEKKKAGWQIEKLNKSLESAFKIGDKIVAIELWDQARRKQLGVLYHTPVRATLRKGGEKLGELLHAMRVGRRDDHDFWPKTGQFLEEVAAELETAVYGTLLGPPLRKPGTNQMSFVTEGRDESINAQLKSLVGGHTLWMKVEYLDSLPEADETAQG